jgi:hypothetical protein
VPILIVKSLDEFVDEIEYIMPVKERCELNDLVIYLEESANGNVTAFYGQVVRLDPLPERGQELFAVSLCLLDIPLAFRSMALRNEHLRGEKIFVIDQRPRYLKALNLRLLATEFPDWTDELEALDPLGLAEAIFLADDPDREPDPDSDPDLDPPPKRPKLVLVK